MKRIQIQRKKGWRMPQGCVRIDRSTKWGNPFTVEEHGLNKCLKLYRTYIRWMLKHSFLFLSDICGKDLACWCALDAPCHGDILIELCAAKKIESIL